ncbi:hypothetical protein Bb109J_c1922 [Bdellovibrio bacteriovorus]|uniref:DUF2945 domain-containing protein n=1 Tax=Bdellovibrio bacteriovorus TaxID=959 RepID=UPI00045BEC4F|nr:DUF2945 domain-containing protein [Bdellovibrio bacteriovorus]AHZ84613.1 hypothetical protein EP01_06635 [Bdellovibrio bacteriovorus]BEV68502.1 hypothetical protein Bb109J_c1922 [Bdellovibrio bacteriovorus]
MKPFKVHDKIQWQWLGRAITGTVEEVYLESVTRTIKGKKITRHGSPEKPAYLVKSDAGNEALKLHTELQPLKKTKGPFKIFADK